MHGFRRFGFRRFPGTETELEQVCGFKLIFRPAVAGREFHPDEVPFHLGIAVPDLSLVRAARIEDGERGSDRNRFLNLEAGSRGRDVLKGREFPAAGTRLVRPADLEQIRAKISQDTPSSSSHEHPIGRRAGNVYGAHRFGF